MPQNCTESRPGSSRDNEGVNFVRGDRVRLTPKLAATRITKCNHQVDWHTRQGTVQAYSKSTDRVIVRWDDRRTLDDWPLRALELVPDPLG